LEFRKKERESQKSLEDFIIKKEFHKIFKNSKAFRIVQEKNEQNSIEKIFSQNYYYLLLIFRKNKVQ
jgi:hypothetical protein